MTSRIVIRINMSRYFCHKIAPLYIHFSTIKQRPFVLNIVFENVFGKNGGIAT